MKDTTLKKILCNKLIGGGYVKEMDIIKHSYSNNRLNRLDNAVEKDNNIAPTLTTRADTLGVVVCVEEKR